MTEHELRVEALRLAVGTKHEADSKTQVKSAEDYYKFLTGGDA